LRESLETATKLFSKNPPRGSLNEKKLTLGKAIPPKFRSACACSLKNRPKTFCCCENRNALPHKCLKYSN
jgi:hypothetical protein